MSITLTALSPRPLPASFLLTIDSAKILLDCGTLDHAPEQLGSNEHDSDPATAATTAAAVQVYLETLRQLAPTLNLVLLSHPLLSSLGLLPWLRSKCDLRCPVYATLPTREMGKWAVDEWVQARSHAELNKAQQEDSNNRQQQQQQQQPGSTTTKQAPGNKRRKLKSQQSSSQQDALVTLDTVEPANGSHQDDDDHDNDDGNDSNPWEVAWKVTAKEIRETFLAVNAVRWTQPVHLSGQCLV